MALEEKTEQRAPGSRMRVVLIATVAIVVCGLAFAGWLFAAATAPTEPEAAPSAPLPVSSESAGPLPGATPVAGSEVLPPSQPVPDGLPAPAKAAPRVQHPLPASSSAVGELVEGYPADLAAPLAGSEVLDTSVATEDGTMQFTMRARTDAPVDELLAQYRAQWAQLGLGAVSDDSYGDDYSAVSISAEAAGTGSTYTIFGVLRAG
jgi:hypothetical protein